MGIIIVENTVTDVIESVSDSAVVETENQVIVEYPVTVTEQIEIITEGPQGPQGPHGADGADGAIGDPGLPPEHEVNELDEIRFKNPDGTWGSWIAIVVDGGTFL